MSGTDRLAAVSPTTGAVDTGFRPKPTYVAFAIAVSGNRVYAAHGGQGGRAIAYDLPGVAKWTPTMDGDAQALACWATPSTSAGTSTTCAARRVPATRGSASTATSCGSSWSRPPRTASVLPWTANGNGVSGVHTMAANAGLGKFAAGGAFTTINGLSQKRFAQFG